MDIDSFSRRVNALQERITSLFSEMQDSRQEQSTYGKESLFELVKALEELQTAEEALNIQASELEQIREQLEKEHQNYQSLFQFSPDGYLVTDKNGLIREANLAACQMLHKEMQFLIGKPLILWIDETDRKLFRSHINLILHDGSVQDFEMRPRHRKGHIQSIFRFTAGPVRSAFGEVISIRWMVHDMTHFEGAEKALEEHRHRFQTIFQLSPVGIQLLDRNGFTLDSNPAAERLLGYGSEELKGLSFLDYVQPEDLEKLVTQYSQLAAGDIDRFRQEVQVHSKTRGSLWVKMSIARFQNASDPAGFAISIIEDITEQRETSRKLFELQENGFKSIIALRQSLAQDLKTGPIEDLSFILHRLENLSQPGPDQMSEIEEIRLALQDSLGVLTKKVNDLANETAISFDLKQAITGFMEQLKWENGSITCTIDCDDNLRAISEPTRITLFNIFTAIVQNRVHQTRPTWFEIHADRQQNTVVLEIQDDRPGEQLPEHVEALIREGQFEFVQAIERVEALHGHISSEGDLNSRSTIRIVAPIEPPTNKELKAPGIKIPTEPSALNGQASNKSYDSKTIYEAPLGMPYDQPRGKISPEQDQ